LNDAESICNIHVNELDDGFFSGGRGSPASADQLTMQEGANISLSATPGPNSTLTISSTDTDENVKVSSDDTMPGFLNGKLVGGTGITLTEGNGGGNETLTIAAPQTLTTKGDVLTHDGANENRLGVGTEGQVLTADSTAANGVKWTDTSRDDTDGVDITFGREVELYEGNPYPRRVLDLNGTDLFLDQSNRNDWWYFRNRDFRRRCSQHQPGRPTSPCRSTRQSPLALTS
jgi:hypothetical protein